MDTERIAEADGQAAADALVAAHARVVEAETEELVLAAHWADLHGVDVDAPGPALPGTERFRRLGGDGTPDVGEFAAAELGCLTGRSLGAASTFMADALDIRHRLPRLWESVGAGTVRVWQAREVARRTRSTGLSAEQARWVDEATTPYLTSLPWARFTALLEAKIVEVDPEAAERRRQAAAMERFVVTGQCNEYGLRTIIAKATAGDAIFFVAMCDRIAEVLAAEGDTDPAPVRRSKAVGILANPARAFALLARHATDGHDGPDEPLDLEHDEGPAGAGAEPTGDPTAFWVAAGIDPGKLLPPATLYLHLSRESFDAARAGRTEGVARMEGVGPVTVAQCAEFLAGTRVTVQPVIDLDADHPVDGYEVPARMHRQLLLRSPAQVFPFSTGPARHADADHTVPYLPPARGGPPGQTRIGNLGPLGRRAHRVKTHAPGWRHRQPRPGVHEWRTPHGYWYRVDPTGTHPLGRLPDARDHATALGQQSPAEAAFAALVAAA